MYRSVICDVFLLSLLSQVHADTLNNRSIDDSFGDSKTFQKPSYYPAGVGVWDNQNCQECYIKPNTSLAFEGTYTAATYNPGLSNISIVMPFEGVAVYVFFILANNVDGATTLTMANFTIDGQIVGSFTHTPDNTTTFVQQMVFNKTDLENMEHQLVISTSGVDFNVFVNFDYAVYTHVDTDITTPDTPSSAVISDSPLTTIKSINSSSPTASSSSPSVSQSTNNPNSLPVPSIVGAVVGTVAGIAICIGCYLFWKCLASKRNKKGSGHIAHLPQESRDITRKNNRVSGITPFHAPFPENTSESNFYALTQNVTPQTKGSIAAHIQPPPSSSDDSTSAVGSVWMPLIFSGNTSKPSLGHHTNHNHDQEMNETAADLTSSNRPVVDEIEISIIRQQVQEMHALFEQLQSAGIPVLAPPEYSQ